MVLALWAGIVAASIWGAMYVVSKAVMAVVPPLTLLALRLLLGALALFPLVARHPRGLGPRPGVLARALAVGAVGYGLSLSLQFLGTDLSTAANGAVITSATPAFVGLFAAWLLKERLGPRRILALAVATLGALVIVDPARMHLDPRGFWGDVLLFLAAVTWALYSVLVRGLTRYLDVLPASMWAFVGGLLGVAPLSLWELHVRPMGTWTVGVWAGVLFLGLISTALAMYLWNYAFARLEAGVAGLTFFAQPVVGTLLSALFLHEPLRPAFFVGAGAIAVGLYLASTAAEPSGRR